MIFRHIITAKQYTWMYASLTFFILQRNDWCILTLVEKFIYTNTVVGTPKANSINNFSMEEDKKYYDIIEIDICYGWFRDLRYEK